MLVRIGNLLGGRRASAWSPLSLPSLAAFHDPSDLSTLFQDVAGTLPVTADGQSVARMNDKSGNGRHYVQATASKRPLYKTDGSLHWLLFDGVDDLMEIDNTSAINFGTSDFAIVVAFRQAANGGNYKVAFGKTDNATAGNYRAFIDDSYGLRLFYGTDSQASSNSNLTATQGQDHVALWGRDTANDRYRLNGTSATKSWAAAGTGSSVFKPTLFSDGSSTYTMGGRFYGGALLDAFPGDDNLASLDTWLGAKAGLTL